MILILLFIFSACVLHFKIGPIVRNTAAMQAKNIAAKAINRATDIALTQKNPKYENLAVVARNSNGDVTSIQTNMAQINAIGNLMTTVIIEEMEALSLQKVHIPLGTLLGSRIFSGRGPKLSFYVVPTGSLESNIKNKFETVGINQTLHQIMLEIDIGILGLLPGYTTQTTVSSQICLAETVIVGAVPDYYTLIEGDNDEELEGMIADYGPGKNGIS